MSEQIKTTVQQKIETKRKAAELMQAGKHDAECFVKLNGLMDDLDKEFSYDRKSQPTINHYLAHIAMFATVWLERNEEKAVTK